MPRPIRRPSLPGFVVLEDRTTPASLVPAIAVNTGHIVGTQSETAIAVNRVNPSQVFEASNDNEANTGGIVSVSKDGGLTFVARKFGTAEAGGDGLPGFISDPTVRFDSAGNLFMAYIATGDRIAIVQSSDGGQTLRLVAQLPGPTGMGVDQPAIDVGPGRSAGETSLWLGFNSEGNYYAVGAAVVGGTVGAFSAPVDVSGGQPASNFGDIAVGPTGQVVVIFQSSTSPGQNTSAVFAATNTGGLGTPAAFSVAAQVTATNVGGWFKIPAQENRSIDAEANLAWDQTAPGAAGHVAPGRVYLTFTDAPSLTSPDTDTLLVYSDNGGSTWSGRTRVNDDAVGASQFLPRPSVDQATGNLAVGWYDTRNAADNKSAEYFAAVSVNGGTSFLKNVALSTGPSNVTASDQNNLGNQFGDWTDVTFVGGQVFAAWSDNSANLDGNTDRPALDTAVGRATFTPDTVPPVVPPTVPPVVPPTVPPVVPPTVPPVSVPSGPVANTVPDNRPIHLVATGSGPGGPSIVTVYDADTGRQVARFQPFEATFTGGVTVAVGYVLGQNIPDIIVAAGPGGGPRVRVYDGDTLEVAEDFFAFEPTFTGGVNVASGDVGQTGFDDIVVGAGVGGGPRVRVFRSDDLAIIRDFFAYDSSFRGGVNVATGTFPGGAFPSGVGATDPLDSFSAILTAAGPGGGPQINVYRADTMAVLASFFAYDASFRGGATVAAGFFGGGDSPGIVTGAGPGGGPHIKVFADDLTEQASFFAFDPTFTGGVRVSAVVVQSLENSEAIVAATGPGPNSRVALLTPTGGRAKPDLVPFAADFLGGVYVGAPDETGFAR